MSTQRGQESQVAASEGAPCDIASIQQQQEGLMPPSKTSIAHTVHDRPEAIIADPQSHEYELRESSELVLTDRGLMYQIDIKERAVSLAVTRWRRKADEIERLLTDSEESVSRRSISIRQARDELSSLMRVCEDILEELYALNPSTRSNIEGINDRHQDIMRRVAEQLKSLKFEKGSYRSRRPSRASSKASTVIEMETAAKAAELSAKLSFCSLEQELEEQQMKLKQKQQQMALERELTMTRAKLQVIKERSNPSFGDSDVDDTLLKLPVDSTRVERFVQQHSVTEHDGKGTSDSKKNRLHSAETSKVYPDTKATQYSDYPTEGATVQITTSAIQGNIALGHDSTFSRVPLQHDVTAAFPPGLNAQASLQEGTLNPNAQLFASRPEFNTGYYHVGYQPPLMSTGITAPMHQRDQIVNAYPGNVSAAYGNSQTRKTQEEPRTDISELARAITQQNNVARLPPPEPGVFTGNPLEYNSWKRSFELFIEQKNITLSEKLYYLRRCDCIEGFLLESSDNAYLDAKARLDVRFGNPFNIACAFRQKLHEWPKIASKDGVALQKLSDFLKQCESAMRTNISLYHLNDAMENQSVLRKLPDILVGRWSRIVQDVKDSTGLYPAFDKFSDFIESEAKLACDPVTSFQALKKVQEPTAGDNKKSTRKEKKQTFLSKTINKDVSKQENTSKGQSDTKTQQDFKSPAEGQKPERKRRPCFMCNENHHINNCPKFLKESLEGRRKYASSNKLCYGCLNPNHLAKECIYKKRCKVCSKPHPTSLHDDK